MRPERQRPRQRFLLSRGAFGSLSGERSNSHFGRSRAVCPRSLAASAASQAVVRAFAGGYARYLDGELALAALPDPTAVAQAQAGSRDPRRRPRRCADRRLSCAAAQPADVHGHSPRPRADRDRAGHRRAAAVPVASRGGRGARHRQHRARTAGGDRAAVGFRARGADRPVALRGYLPWLYGEERSALSAARQMGCWRL